MTVPWSNRRTCQAVSENEEGIVYFRGQVPLQFETGRRTQRNPTNGSWWIVQILSTKRSHDRIESHPREWVDGSDPFWRCAY